MQLRIGNSLSSHIFCHLKLTVCLVFFFFPLPGQKSLPVTCWQETHLENINKKVAPKQLNLTYLKTGVMIHGGLFCVIRLAPVKIMIKII